MSTKQTEKEYQVKKFYSVRLRSLTSFLQKLHTVPNLHWKSVGRRAGFSRAVLLHKVRVSGNRARTAWRRVPSCVAVPWSWAQELYPGHRYAADSWIEVENSLTCVVATRHRPVNKQERKLRGTWFNAFRIGPHHGLARHLQTRMEQPHCTTSQKTTVQEKIVTLRTPFSPLWLILPQEKQRYFAPTRNFWALQGWTQKLSTNRNLGQEHGGLGLFSGENLGNIFHELEPQGRCICPELNGAKTCFTQNHKVSGQ